MSRAQFRKVFKRPPKKPLVSNDTSQDSKSPSDNTPENNSNPEPSA